MTRGPLPRNVAIGEAVVTILRDAGSALTNRELCDLLGFWNMPQPSGCGYPVPEASDHQTTDYTAGWTFISCTPTLDYLGNARIWAPSSHGRVFQAVTHTWHRPLRPSDITSTLTRLAKAGELTKTTDPRFRSTLWSSSHPGVDLNALEHLWAQS